MSTGIGVDAAGREHPVLYERVGNSAVVTINRPDSRNAIDGATADALQVAYEQFVADDGALVMILTGAGDEAFCAGADLKAVSSFAHRIDSAGGPLGFTRLISPKPTIAAISGWALAGGFELALWCDLRICADGTTFGFAERRWGVPLIDGGTQRLAQIVGLGRALDLILTGRMLELHEAHSMGLITEPVATGRHLTRALELAESLAHFPRETMLADRAAVYAGLGVPLADGLAIESKNGAVTANVAAKGAAQFAAGAGRNGEGVAK